MEINYAHRSARIPMSIKHIESLQILEDLAKELTQNSLVIFDVGGVLLTPSCSILRHPAKEIREKLQAEIFADVERATHQMLWSKVLLQAQRKLLEPITSDIIKRLQHKAIVMGLTSLYHGPLGLIPSMEDWRINQLIKHGISFESAFPRTPQFMLTELIRKDLTPPLFKQGIVFMHRYTKGEVLDAFLRRMNLKPNTIVFVDDQIPNIESVAQTARHHDAKYHGLHYKIEEIITGPVDIELGRLQFQHLHDYGEWLSEEEVKKRYRR